MIFDEIYAHVPHEQREGFRQFRQDHPEKSIVIDGITWRYLTAGTSDPVILWLVGGLKMADAAWRSIPILSDEFRIIAPSYPAIATISGLADGLSVLLDAENIESAYVLAGSFGGMLAQELVRRHPKRVSKLILSTTTPPDQTQIERYQQLLQLVEAAPETMVREQAQAQMFTVIAPPADEAEFYRAYLQELYTQRLNKADIVSTYQAILDFMGRTYSGDDLANWTGELLIFASDNDATFNSSVQQQIETLYPMAQRYIFKGAGHSPGSTQRELFFRKARDFFSK